MSRNCSECGRHLLKAAARWSGHHRMHACITKFRIYRKAKEAALELLEAWLVLTSVSYHGNVWVSHTPKPLEQTMNKQ